MTDAAGEKKTNQGSAPEKSPEEAMGQGEATMDEAQREKVEPDEIERRQGEK